MYIKNSKNIKKQNEILKTISKILDIEKNKNIKKDGLKNYEKVTNQ